MKQDYINKKTLRCPGPPIYVPAMHIKLPMLCYQTKLNYPYLFQMYYFINNAEGNKFLIQMISHYILFPLPSEQVKMALYLKIRRNVKLCYVCLHPLGATSVF